MQRHPTPLTPEELGSRLRAARNGRKLTQDAVASELGIPRTAVVELEAGRRAVSSIELTKLARLFGRTVGDLLDEGGLAEDPVDALFRAEPPAAEDAEFRARLEGQIALCREARSLEGLLERAPQRALAIGYEVEPPPSRWDAIQQGRWLAEEERGRLDLGNSPLGGIADVLRGEGVRVAAVAMPDDVSGVFVHGRDIGAVILVNERRSRVRRVHSCAHEYCHLLVDRDRVGEISRSSMGKELREMRANAFAAHFLMPEAGVRAFLRGLGKDLLLPGRQEIYGDEADLGGASFVAESVPAPRRAPAESREIQIHDVVAVAHRFCASIPATLYHLLNLKVLSKERFEALRSQEDAVRALLRELWETDEDAATPERWTLKQEILGLALEAYSREAISRRKLLQLAGDLGAARKTVEAVLAAESDSDEHQGVLEPT